MEFEVYEDAAGRHRWRLLSRGKKVAASGESFAGKSNAERAARRFKGSALCDRYRVWMTNGEWYWDAAAANGRKLATGGEAFASRFDAERAASNVRVQAGEATGA